MPQTAAEVADQLYARWNGGCLRDLIDSVDPDVELICDPLRPVESALHGTAGWEQWVKRWQETYETMRITIDGLLPTDDEHVLALVSIDATPCGGGQQRSWAAAHLWTIRAGRVVRWETHLDLGLARGTLL